MASQLKGKLIVGEVEKFFLTAAETVYNARIDSGAETSSIDARNIVRFERDGSNWVRFDVPVPGDKEPGSEELLTLEKEVSRRVRILQSNVEDPERRVVAFMRMLIGIPTSGTFMPVLIAVAFVQTTLIPGLVAFLSVVAICAYLLMSAPLAGHLTFNFPELHLVILGLILLMGNYTGYKLSELRRFTPMKVYD